MMTEKGPFGEGSQLASLSLPGDSFWISSVNPPSVSLLNSDSIVELSKYRFSGLATSRQDGCSYIVNDQKELTGGNWPAANLIV